ncbi:Cobalt-dependent inorganic pyrophosphatase [Rosistilla oblonga]|uniref:putative manganese-dependent inorganic diphosphatase n=1 Tax=Rosistilla oblonga TaxID=2527990 RepID=UPI0011889155|nr:putative manganese-dependent inorganic diphosphatase [Rosistilla oblonga]QDV11879.1 Cobalt-dependent inorganic pyrophosphatase [Rosistilla oblonga]
MSLFVFGHKNPDTDAICSALAYANLLKKTSRPDAIACCCGPPNKRTEFVLRRAGLDTPRIVMDVRPEVEDVCRTDVVTACDTDIFSEVYERLKQHSLRAIPVLSSEGELVGILNLLDLLELVFHGDGDPTKSRTVNSSLAKICECLKGHFQHVSNADQRDDFIVSVGAMSAHGFVEHIKDYPPEKLLVVSGDRPTIQLPALERGVRCLVVTGGYTLSPGLLELAKAKDVSVLVSPFDTATTTVRIKSARAIGPAITDRFLSLSNKDTIAYARSSVERSRQSIFPVVDDSQRLCGVLSKSDLIDPPKPQLVLVDHNELGQAVDGAAEAEIIEVLDHHRLGGGLRSSQPIRFINEPVGSTCTLVAMRYRAAGIEPAPAYALCMASGIISDTIKLRSPTTTDIDREIYGWLASLCTCDLDEFAHDFFEIGSALQTCSPEEVVAEDCKEFSEAGHRFSISQIEELGFGLFWDRQQEIRKALEGHAKEKGLDFAALLVTDISSSGSLLMMSSEPACWEEINYPRVGRNLYKLENVVSRKKQLLPLICSLLDSQPEPME